MIFFLLFFPLTSKPTVVLVPPRFGIRYGSLSFFVGSVVLTRRNSKDMVSLSFPSLVLFSNWLTFCSGKSCLFSFNFEIGFSAQNASDISVNCLTATSTGMSNTYIDRRSIVRKESSKPGKARIFEIKMFFSSFFFLGLYKLNVLKVERIFLLEICLGKWETLNFGLFKIWTRKYSCLDLVWENEELQLFFLLKSYPS